MNSNFTEKFKSDSEDPSSFTIRTSSPKSIISYRKFNSIVELPPKLFVPNIQRNIIKEHVDFMGKYIQECAAINKEPIFGTIDLVLFGDNYYLVDGQHRYCAIYKEYTERKIIVPIYSLIYEVDSESQIEEIFKIRNRGIPVPDFMLSVKEGKKDLLKEISTYLETRCPEIFKQSGGHTRPKININTFLEHLRETKVFKTLITLDDFKKLFNNLNQECFNRFRKMTDKQIKKYGVTENMIAIWSQYKIYIGYSRDFDYLDFQT
jgi:hypothetical protein